MRRKIRIARILLILCLVVLIPGSMNNHANNRRAEEGLYASIRELIRVPLAHLSPGTTIRFRVWIPESMVGESSAGHRFFQASIKEYENHSKQTLPWNSSLVSVTVKQEGKELPLRLTQTPFYLEGYATGTTLGVAFDPEERKECEIEITPLGGSFKEKGELVVAPNWPNPMLIKDQIVGAMLEPAFDKALTWFTRAGLALTLVALVSLFSIQTKGIA